MLYIMMSDIIDVVILNMTYIAYVYYLQATDFFWTMD